jgi:hypothetical protein
MTRKDEIRIKVAEAVELLPDIANAVKSVDIPSMLSQTPHIAGLGAAAIGSWASKRFGRKNPPSQNRPTKDPKKIKPKSIPGIFSIGDPRARS